VLRIVTEVFRQPDKGVALLQTPLGALQRGQALSTLTVLAGALLVLAAARMGRCRRE
jgi:prolipoprotein diacylglyceryltransferase